MPGKIYDNTNDLVCCMQTCEPFAAVPTLVMNCGVIGTLVYSTAEGALSVLVLGKAQEVLGPFPSCDKYSIYQW